LPFSFDEGLLTTRVINQLKLGHKKYMISHLGY